MSIDDSWKQRSIIYRDDAKFGMHMKMRNSLSKRPIVFFWENFGPMHTDRVEAVWKHFGAYRPVVGVELRETSDVYDWAPAEGSFEKITLFSGKAAPGRLKLLWALVNTFRKLGRGDYFLCHYNWIEVFLVAWILRFSGSNVVAMGCSKFDDKLRNANREFLKSFFLKPYNGAIGSGKRSKDYFRFLGVRVSFISGEYNTLSVQRFRDSAGVTSAPTCEDHAGRHFTSIARFVPKKNLFVLLDAFSMYRAAVSEPRELHLCGSGELEDELRQKVKDLGLSQLVRFRGFLQTEEVSRVLANSIALLMPSTEEQFGNVVIEALALGVPVILSDNCGARDILVRTGVNGFVVESDNPDGYSYFMAQICSDRRLWLRLASAAYKTALKGDIDCFIGAVGCHIEEHRRMVSSQ